MARIYLGGLLGSALGVVVLLCWGMSDGFSDGLPTASLPPGFEAAWKSAFVYAMYLWPLALILGGGAGALCGFGTGLAKALSRPAPIPANSTPRRVGSNHGR